MIGRTVNGSLLRLSLLLLVIAVGFGVALPVERASAQAGSTAALTVDPGTSRGTISRYVYGVNYGPWALVPPDLWPLAKEAQISYLRFPAGNWGDRNDIQTTQIDLLMLFAKQIGAEPTITVRLYNGTPEKAAELVRYTNIEKKYGVTYWSIGNEPNLLPEEFPNDSPSLPELITNWRSIAEAMLAVDPTIKFVGPDISQYPYSADAPAYLTKIRDFLSDFLKANGDLISIVTIHRYPFPLSINAPATTIEQLKSTAAEWDYIIPNLREVVKEATGRDLPVGVTEINSHWNKPMGGPASVESHYNAIWWADVLGRLIRQKTDMVAFWLLGSYGELGGHGLLAKYEARPTYYVYPMYKMLGEELLTSSTDSQDVSITAAKRADGALTLMLVNLSTEERQVTLSISGMDAVKAAETWRFDPEHNAEQVATDESLAGTVTLPGQSMTLYVIAP
ncbi:MAG: hypothetical protein U0528_16780 [Anaerolineae bacterium]